MILNIIQDILGFSYERNKVHCTPVLGETIDPSHLGPLPMNFSCLKTPESMHQVCPRAQNKSQNIPFLLCTEVYTPFHINLTIWHRKIHRLRDQTIGSRELQ